MQSNSSIEYKKLLKKDKQKKRCFLFVFLFLFLVFAFFSLFFGSSSLSFKDSFFGLFGKGESTAIRIRQKIRLPRVLAGTICGIGLALSGLIRQTCLDNPRASPSTLGVSNAAVLGANVAIIILSKGRVHTDNNNAWNSFNPFAVSSIAFLFALGSIFLILALAKIQRFSPETLVLAGVCLSSLFTAITTLLQYFATDTELSSAVYWSFGDLGRAGYREILIRTVMVLVSYFVFTLFRSHLNARTLGEEEALATGVNTEFVRFLLLSLASLRIACSISFLGVIGFIGLICPHIARKLFSSDHSYLLPSTSLFGAFLLLFADDLARILLKGFSLPVGAITPILGTPFFLILLFRYERRKKHA